MAAETSRSGGGSAADSYLGSLISLTSKYEIRYEGVLYNINTEESSIGLRNVRSFGTEGRKKDGPQIPPSDKIYEYILFRGSDIKDLQVKSSPPPQSSPPIHDDPAIIQSHYSRPAPVPTTIPPPLGTGTPVDNSHAASLGMPRSTFQGALPLYQPGSNLGSWGSNPPPPNLSASGFGMPMYWQGYYGPSGSLPPLQQQTLIRPPPGMPMPHSVQQTVQYPGMNASLTTGSPNLPNFPEFPPPLLPPVSSTSLTSTILPSTVASTPATALPTETSSTLMPNKAPVTSLPVTNIPFVPPSTSSLEATVPPGSTKPMSVPSPALLPYPTVSQSVSTIVVSSSSNQSETSAPSLVTPGQFLKPGPSVLSSSQSKQTVSTEVEVKPVPSEPLTLAPNELKEPILPLPVPTVPYHKLSGATLHQRHSYRGRERGRGNGPMRPLTKFTEDFDFIAMNEKFNKDEVWGHLGKSQMKDNDWDAKEDDADYAEEEDHEAGKAENKPVYVKDDFFDTLSCNALDHGSRNGRTKFSEQMKIDTETFGDFPRHRNNRGGGRGMRGGGRYRGGYYGRGYGGGGGGGGYVGRGRGQTASYHGN
ncbi:Protein decapping 5 [Acorus calamus]|uniref:Protein decapping 5 n=1 Tax=Acorus calamus TaxID=4465 RepID=A0AAV9DAH7_ACOCL|nr:Protein decapping 5 [Acorus calamus]